jgi:hypothetical protein
MESLVAIMIWLGILDTEVNDESYNNSEYTQLLKDSYESLSIENNERGSNNPNYSFEE